jgi:hypothetical protein
MKAETFPSWLSFTGPEARRWWRRPAGESGFQASEPPRKGEKGAYAFAAAECDSIPVWVASAEPEIVERVLEMELDRLGIRLPGGPGQHLGWRMVGSDGPRRLIHAIVVPAALEPALAEIAVDWAAFFPAPLFLRPPSRSIVLWREAGRWIAGFTHVDEWVHFQNLGPGELNADLLREIQCIHLDLDGRRMVGTIDVLTLWTDDSEPVRASFRDEAHRILGLPVCATAAPPLSIGLTKNWRFLPAAIAVDRMRQSQLRQWLSIGLAASLVFLMAIGAGATRLTFARMENERLRERLESLEPAASVVREAKERWEAMELAVDVDRYPVELFYRVASLFPERGLRMTHFEIRENGDVVVRGEASSVPVAIGFKADLENAPGLGAYQWTIPAPEIQGETATFVATGAYRFASVEP